MAFYQCEKFFCFKEQFVHLLAALELISLCEHHGTHNTTSCIPGKDYFQLFFGCHKQESRQHSTRIISKSCANALSLHSDHCHTRYGKNIISKSYAIALSPNSDTCHTQYGNQYGTRDITSIYRYTAIKAISGMA
jgi:hypothetical protein